MPDRLSVTALDIDTLARTLWGEIRGETLRYKCGIAVGWVIRNRLAKHNWMSHLTTGERTKILKAFGRRKAFCPTRSITSVCLKPLQFSCWWDTNAGLMTVADLDGAAFQDCMAAALAVVLGHEDDPTSGSTHYHRYDIHPNWASGKTPVGRTGSHLFYNDVE